MNEDEVVEKTESDIEKDGAAREYSKEYFEELRAAAKEYLPKTVWDHINSKARNKAGGRNSGKARSAATSATTALSEPESAPAAVEMQPPVAKDSEPEVEKQEEKLHPDCQKVADNCMKMKKSDEGSEIEKSLTDPEKSKLAAEVKTKSTADLTAYNRRMAMWAAQGNLLSGFSQADMNWFHSQLIAALKAKADAAGTESTAGAPLKWGAITQKSAESDVEKCHFGTVDEIAARAKDEESSSKSAKKEEKAKKQEKTVKAEEAEEVEESKEVTKVDTTVEPFTGSQPLVTFVAASPGVIESLRKEALVGPSGRIFNEQYLEPMGITRDDIAITYLIPRLLKDEAGKVREPTESEIKAESFWKDEQQVRRSAASEPIVVALGHTVKKSLGTEVAVTLPHPNALGTPRTNQELIRKREQLKKMVQAKLNYLEYGRLRKSMEKRR
jgi:uracil-DNA glycosylase